eukprot:1179601-Prorocentrum_minimum.AAC.1
MRDPSGAVATGARLRPAPVGLAGSNGGPPRTCDARTRRVRWIDIQSGWIDIQSGRSAATRTRLSSRCGRNATRSRSGRRCTPSAAGIPPTPASLIVHSSSLTVHSDACTINQNPCNVVPYGRVRRPAAVALVALVSGLGTRTRTCTIHPDPRMTPPLPHVGRYEDLRTSLKARGWHENPDPYSLFFDLRWSVKAKDVDHKLLRAHQIVNHFGQVSGCITTKAGLLSSLTSELRCASDPTSYGPGVRAAQVATSSPSPSHTRGSRCRHMPRGYIQDWYLGILVDRWFTDVDSSVFFPRCYDLNSPSDFSAFVTDFRWCAADGVLKKALQDGGLTPKGVPTLEILRLALEVGPPCLHAKWGLLDKNASSGKTAASVVLHHSLEAVHSPLQVSEHRLRHIRHLVSPEEAEVRGPFAPFAIPLPLPTPFGLAPPPHCEPRLSSTHSPQSPSDPSVSPVALDPHATLVKGPPQDPHKSTQIDQIDPPCGGSVAEPTKLSANNLAELNPPVVEWPSKGLVSVSSPTAVGNKRAGSEIVQYSTVQYSTVQYSAPSPSSCDPPALHTPTASSRVARLAGVFTCSSPLA